MRRPFLTLLICILGFQYLVALENHPAGARSLALSNAFVSISDVWSTFHNQAGLTGIEYFSAGVFYESRFMIDELSHSAGSFILPVNAGTFGFSFSQFGQGSFKENKLGLAFAKQLSEKFHAGIQLDYFLQRFPENSSAFGFATFEAGIIYSPNKKLFLGAHVFNPISNGIETLEGKQKMPAIFRFGGHYNFDEMVLLTVEIQKDYEHPFLLKTGIEFSPVENLALRFGVSGKPVNYTAGLGYTFGKITTDIGFGYHGNLGLTPSISMQFRL
ncbi:MAG: hypothetical protein HQ522_14765 [Bacteroidetes bacterium]|nr:hypothetical protein [Bacteroidota bacterium]